MTKTVGMEPNRSPKSLEETTRWRRREFLKLASASGVGSIVFGRALVALAADKPALTEKMIRQAGWIAGIDVSDDHRKLMLEGMQDLLGDLEKLRAVPLSNAVAPALRFETSPHAQAPAPAAASAARPESSKARRPASSEDLAFATVAELGALLRAREVSSVELTRLYLERLQDADPTLHCVIHLTDDLALRQAEQADRELAAGRERGPLHGIPWGAKDLLTVPGYPTTWGATPYKDQMLDVEATVATRLAEAGAVLVAKLSVGALAWGDVWFKEMTRNPWNIDQGSSGSSAGPASATAAGLVGFAIGTETWGSIVSPCTRCGASGLRPTFGRVSRHGVMALSWSMDKIGPIARSAEDCALVFDAIRGPDGHDPTVVDRPFGWPRGDLRSLKIGYLADLFEEDRAADVEDEGFKSRVQEWQKVDLETLDTLRALGAKLTPMKLPEGIPVGPLALILTAEASTAFDELTRSGQADELVRQVANAWPNVFRQGQFIPAVEYLRANRIRTLLMQETEAALDDVDVYVSPSFGGDNLLLTNLTGHPCAVVPNGFTSPHAPTSITFCGRLFGEAEVLTVARAFQDATDFHRRRPSMTAPEPEGEGQGS